MKLAHSIISPYQKHYAAALAAIYYHTIHTVNIRDYTREQLNVWAPQSSLKTEGWVEKWEKLPPYVALIDNIPVGFTEFDHNNGYIDCFYVHHGYQNQSIGTVLMEAVWKEARRNKVKYIRSEVSITAKTFFEKKGFRVVKKQMVTIRGVALQNFVMIKMLGK